MVFFHFCLFLYDRMSKRTFVDLAAEESKGYFSIITLDTSRKNGVQKSQLLLRILVRKFLWNHSRMYFIRQLYLSAISHDAEITRILIFYVVRIPSQQLSLLA